MPVLLPENMTVWELFSILRTQPAVAGMGGVTGINLTIAPALMDDFGVPHFFREAVWHKLAVLSETFATVADRKAAEKQAKAESSRTSKRRPPKA